MRVRSLSVSLTIAAAFLVPVSVAPAASAAETVQRTTLTDSPFRSSAFKRAKAAAVKAAALKAATPTVSAIQQYQDETLRLTNNERTSRGLKALTQHSCANTYADRWAIKIAADGALSHQSMQAMMDGCKARGAGENVAYGNITPAELMKLWMDSPGHRANILNAKFTHIGIGAVQTSTGRVYSVQTFLTY